MLTYTVQYKQKGKLFRSTLKRVKGDGIEACGMHSYRWFILEDETRIEVPVADTTFTFSNGRFLTIKANMESEVGQAIPTKGGA